MYHFSASKSGLVNSRKSSVTIDHSTLVHVERYEGGWVLVKGKTIKEGGHIVATCESQKSAMTEMQTWNHSQQEATV